MFVCSVILNRIPGSTRGFVSFHSFSPFLFIFFYFVYFRFQHYNSILLISSIRFLFHKKNNKHIHRCVRFVVGCCCSYFCCSVFEIRLCYLERPRNHHDGPFIPPNTNERDLEPHSVWHMRCDIFVFMLQIRSADLVHLHWILFFIRLVFTITTIFSRHRDRDCRHQKKHRATWHLPASLSLSLCVYHCYVDFGLMCCCWLVVVDSLLLLLLLDGCCCCWMIFLSLIVCGVVIYKWFFGCVFYYVFGCASLCLDLSHKNTHKKNPSFHRTHPC